MVPNGYYFLVFSTVGSAKVYQRQVSRLRDLAYKHVLRCLEGPIPPPPGYIVDGMDVYQAIQSYTLVPPSRNLILKLLYPPFPAKIDGLLRHGDYAFLRKHDIDPARAVNICVDGYQPTTDELYRLFRLDNVASRGADWRLIERDAITKIDPPELQYIERARRQDQSRDDSKPIGFVAPRWIVMFDDAAEAHRFVRDWHKRPLGSSPGSENQASGVINAELLWR